MHIMLVNNAQIPVFAYGGTERVVWDLGLALVELGHEVTFLVPAGSSCSFANVQFIDPDKSWQAQIPSHVDVVHFQFHPGSEPKQPYLVTEHGNGQVGQVGQALLKNTVFVSKNHALRHGSDQYVLNGLDWRNYAAPNWDLPRTHTHFLGKAAWRVKNVRGAIDVAKHANTTIAVLGGNRFNFKRGIRLTFTQRATFYGMVGGPQKFDLLNRSNGLIFPVTWHEPFGLAVIESLFYGCPVFATPYGALPEIVTPSVGVLCTKAEELAVRLQNHLQDEAFSFESCHRRAVDAFNSHRMATGYETVYRRVASGLVLHKAPPTGLAANADKLPWK